MKDEKYKVSICIPAYNGENFISKAIESCLKQTYENIEIVIVDDCSIDNTLYIVQNYLKKDKRIKLYKNKRNLGLSKNFLKSFILAKGEYIQHLGQDDWLDINYIEKKIEIFIKFPEIGFVSGGLKVFELNNSKIYYKKSYILKDGFYTSNYIYKNFYKLSNPIIGLFCFFRKKDILDNFLITIPNKFNYDIFYKKGMVIDNYFILKILKKYDLIYYTSETFYNTLSHKDNSSKKYGFNMNEFSQYFTFFNIDFVGFNHFFSNYCKKYEDDYIIFKGSDLFVSFIFSILKNFKNLSFNNIKLIFYFYKNNYKIKSKFIIFTFLRIFYIFIKRVLNFINNFLKK